MSNTQAARTSGSTAGEWVTVPREPTPEMIWAGRARGAAEVDKEFHPDNPDPLAASYRAMLAAAPPAPTVSAEPVAWAVCHEGKPIMLQLGPAPSPLMQTAGSVRPLVWGDTAPPLVSVPDGWVMVPRSAVEKLARAMVYSDPEAAAKLAYDAWVEISEAPSPPVSVGAEPVVWPTEAELIAFGTEEEHFLSCDQDDYAQIALEILAKFGRRVPPPVEASQQQADSGHTCKHCGTDLSCSTDHWCGASQQQCPCGEREASKCPGEWEPGCDLGANEEFARRVAEPASGKKADPTPDYWVLEDEYHIVAVDHEPSTPGISWTPVWREPPTVYAELSRLAAERDALKAENRRLLRQNARLAAIAARLGEKE